METPAEFLIKQLEPLLTTAAIRSAAQDFVEAMVAPFDGLAEIADSDTHDGLGILFDVEACPDWALPWLGQAVGVNDIRKLTPDVQRQMIRERRGTKRGTLASLVSEVQATLTGSKFVFVIERYQDSPYKVAVITKTSETPNPAKTAARAKAALPAGRILTHTVVTGQTYAQAAAAAATYTDASGLWPTYTAAQNG